MFSFSSLPCRGLDRSQACINFCFGYSVFLETHLQAIINSLECWQNIQTCRQASDDTTLGKSSGSSPNSEEGEEEARVCSRGRGGRFSQLVPLCHPSVWTSETPHCQQECSLGGHLSRPRRELKSPERGFYPDSKKNAGILGRGDRVNGAPTDSHVPGQLQAEGLEKPSLNSRQPF